MNAKAIIGGKTQVVRIGAVQWQLRNFGSEKELIDAVEFFVGTLSQYNADFFLLPEYFSAPLMAQFHQKNAVETIRQLADYTEEIRDRLIQFAVEYNINIIGGSLPHFENGVLTNVSFLCHRDGTWDVQRKIHITPSEDVIALEAEAQPVCHITTIILCRE